MKALVYTGTMQSKIRDVAEPQAGEGEALAILEEGAISPEGWTEIRPLGDGAVRPQGTGCD